LDAPDRSVDTDCAHLRGQQSHRNESMRTITTLKIQRLLMLSQPLINKCGYQLGRSRRKYKFLKRTNGYKKDGLKSQRPKVLDIDTSAFFATFDAQSTLNGKLYDLLLLVRRPVWCAIRTGARMYATANGRTFTTSARALNPTGI